jgi:hypothetical protein
MTVDPLLSNDLLTLLRAFPNRALRDLVGVMKGQTSLSPFPAPRAYEAHALPDDGDFLPHTDSIAREVLWWGSNDLHRQFGEDRLWREVVARTARHIDVAEEERTSDLPAWKMEDDRPAALPAGEPTAESRSVRTTLGLDRFLHVQEQRER